MGLEQAALGSFSLEEEEDVAQMVHDSKEPTLSTTHIRAAELEDTVKPIVLPIQSVTMHFIVSYFLIKIEIDVF